MKRTNAAKAIARGLILSGRGRRQQDIDGFICLQRRAGGWYFNPLAGHELRKGESLDEAEPVQRSFVAAMLAAGQSAKN